MITLKEEKNKAEALFRDKNIKFTQNSSCLLASNGEEILGFCLFDIDNEKITIK